MKNMNEFRRTVLEKAEQYEKGKKRQRKKIREIVLLCSFCIAISLSAYLGLILNMDASADTSPSEKDSLVEDTPPSSLPIITSEPEASGTISTTEVASTKNPELDTTASSSEEDTVYYCVDFSFHPEISPQTEYISCAIILQSKEEMDAYLSILQERYHLDSEKAAAVRKHYSAEFFETQNLICSEIIADCSVIIDGLGINDARCLTLYYWELNSSDSKGHPELSLEFISIPQGTYTGIQVVLKNS